MTNLCWPRAAAAALLSFASCAFAEPGSSTANEHERPNVLIIVADDLGYTDIGAFGGEIRTPHLDALAARGTQLTSFHTAPACAPTRAMLMTGAYNHQVGLGMMVEYMTLAAPEYLGLPGYEGYLTDRAKTLPEYLGDAGYRTYMSGKWHLGLDDATSPSARGFQRSYSMLEGAAGHFDDRVVTPGTGHDRVLFREDGELVRPVADFYSSRTYADKLISYLDADKDSDEPFLAYLSFTAPHWPLQAPEASIAAYEGMYDDGYDILYERRLRRQKSLGLVDPAFGTHLTAPDYREWQSLNAEERRYSARLMEIYAAMVSDMDREIGRVINKLRQINALDNTVVLFFSDNGATGGGHVRMRVFADLIKACCDNSYENMGRATSYLVPGSGWARVSSGANKFFKGNTTEGGILSPAIVTDFRRENSHARYDQFLTVMDVLPTLLELAELELPRAFDASAVPVEGRSFAAVIAGSGAPTHTREETVGWEWVNNRALWRGDLKLVMTQPPLGKGEWSLYNIAEDPHETINLADAQPALLQSMITEWERYARESGVILDPATHREGGAPDKSVEHSDENRK